MIDVREQRISGRRSRIIRDQFLERLIRTPQHLVGVEHRCDRAEIAHCDPALEQLAYLLPPPPSISLVDEVQPEATLQVAKLSTQPRGLDEAAPLPRRERERNHPTLVAGDEIAAERPVNVVAETAARLILENRLADEAQVAGNR